MTSKNVSTIHDIACNIDEAIRCLDVHVGHNQTSCDTLNWETKILEIEKLFNTWKKSDLTFLGKNNVIKACYSEAHSKCSDYSSQKIYIDRLKRLCFTFIWGKRDRIRRNTLIAPVNEDGLNMLDIESFFSSIKSSMV